MPKPLPRRARAHPGWVRLPRAAGAWLAGTGALLGLVGLVVGLAVMGPAGAQQASAPTPFPRPLMAFVPVPAGGPADPALAVQTLAVAEGNGVGTGGDRRVTIGFASAFTLPAADYRVSVVWGTPNGSQTRASLLSTDGATSGSVQTSVDGKVWEDAGTTNATFADDSVGIDATLGDATPGAGLWVQAQVGSDPTTQVSSPVYSADAALGRVTDGALPATSWGSPSVPADPAPVAFGTTAPTMAVVNQALVVTDPAPAPTKVAGQAVTSVVDEVTFLPGYTPSGTVSGAVQIDRTAGTIRAFTGTSGLPEDRTGSGTWVTSGLAPPPASSTSPMKVTLDLEGVSKALGIPLDANGTGIGLRRKVVLADGTAVVGLPVVGTVGWYQTAAVPTAAPPGTEAPGATTPVDPPADSSSSSVPLIAGVVVAVVLLALAAVAVVRRRRRVRSIEADLFGLDDADRTGALEPEPATGAAEPQPEPEPEAEAEAEPEPEPEPEPETRPARSGGGRSPAEVLAALDAHVEDLSARVERLGPAPEPDPGADHPSQPGTPPDQGPGER